MTDRIDVHQHLVPGFYRDRLAAAGIAEAGGRHIPDWSVEAALGHMSMLGVATAILSVSTPGVSFLDDPGEALALAKQLNTHSAALVASQPERFGWFATVPLADVAMAAAEAARALDSGADGVTLLANNRGTYLGEKGQDALFDVLDERSAVAFIHPAELTAPMVEGIPPFADDFLLDTTRAAYLLVRNRVVERYPRIRFVLSHAGGFLHYASHRMALTIAAGSGRSPLDVLEDFRGFYFDTALSSSPAALPSLLAFARPERIVFGSDFPFAPTTAGRYFANGLDTYDMPASTRVAIDNGNAAALFPRLSRKPTHTPQPSAIQRLQLTARQVAARLAGQVPGRGVSVDLSG